MKPYLARLPLITGLAALVVILSWRPADVPTVLAQQPETEQLDRSVSVSGMGQVNVEPDMAVIVVGVQTEAAGASAALTQNNEQMQTVIDALTGAGIAEEDIQTQAVQLQPISPSPDQPLSTTAVTGTITQTGYIATNLVEARVRELGNLGTLLDTVVQAGSNRVDNIRFEVSDPQQALAQAREIAWNDAQLKAAQLAQLAGTELGEVLRVGDVSAVPFATAGVTLAAEAAPVPIQPGSQTVSVNLQVTWRLGQ